VLRAEGLVTKTGRPFDKGAVYKLLVNRTYLGEAVHKGKSYPGEHAAIIPRDLWDRVHAILAESPRARAAKNRAKAPALLRGLLFGPDGRAMSPTHTRKKGRLYRYYVSQTVLQGGPNDAPHRRLPAGEIEGLVMAQVRALLRQPEVVVGTWRAARAEAPDLSEAEVREALGRLDPLWDELFPGEQERIVRLLVERVTVTDAGAEIRLNLEGLAGLARDMAARQPQEALAA
ncbi:MAG: recombinase family protein, partial [Elioraea tepidiphila]